MLHSIIGSPQIFHSIPFFLRLCYLGVHPKNRKRLNISTSIHIYIILYHNIIYIYIYSLTSILRDTKLYGLYVINNPHVLKFTSGLPSRILGHSRAYGSSTVRDDVKVSWRGRSFSPCSLPWMRRGERCMGSGWDQDGMINGSENGDFTKLIHWDIPISPFSGNPHLEDSY